MCTSQKTTRCALFQLVVAKLEKRIATIEAHLAAMESEGVDHWAPLIGYENDGEGAA